MIHDAKKISTPSIRSIKVVGKSLFYILIIFRARNSRLFQYIFLPECQKVTVHKHKHKISINACMCFLSKRVRTCVFTIDKYWVS
jgi:hypothetical protein